MSYSSFLKTIAGEPQSCPPVWLMRQAGRYLPEYRATRATAGSFLDLCYTPELAEEVTLQPIRRFQFDASILFSDILVIPDALGQKVSFVEGKGPVLEKLTSEKDISALKSHQVLDHLKPVFETVSRLRKSLPEDTALIGFCGAPFTLATYMLTGQGSKDQAETREFAFSHPDQMQRLIDILVNASIDYLSQQIQSGADCVKIFDSWAGALAERELLKWSFEPIERIVEAIKARHPNTPVIIFPRGAGVQYEYFAKHSKADVIAFDFNVPAQFIADKVYPHKAVQGALDPMALVAGGEALESEVKRFLSIFDSGRYIFNLGHGIVPQTPIANVDHLLKLIRG